MSHYSDYYTPRIIPRDALLLNAYLIFEDPSVDKFLSSELGSQKRDGADYEFIKQCRNNHPNWEDRFIHCKMVAIATGNLCDGALSADDILKKLDH